MSGANSGGVEGPPAEVNGAMPTELHPSTTDAYCTASAAPPLSMLSAALLVQQLPLLHMFSGESVGVDEESFEGWKDQFEMVASICHWDSHTKLVNLVT